MFTYIVMEKLEGCSIAQLLENRDDLGEREIWTIFNQVVDGLRHIHSKGYIHGDIKLEVCIKLRHQVETLSLCNAYLKFVYLCYEVCSTFHNMMTLTH